MRYKVTQTETVEYVLEAKNEEEVWEFMKCCTTRELRALKHDIKTQYSAAIVEKTVMPADFHYDDEIPEILDDVPEELLNHSNEDELKFYFEIPFN
ncbi:hypothetical protein SAMN05421493_104155 [Pseudobutyrivibrio sp. 49]|uniref:hypothetical protein n=1 Tax=unclassified Pseudobutyrivibrio TaxID=2638619 RepID=UPI00087E6F40|nr:MULTISPECIES: hypothetical protein [unclassified Pseudobutyrivibrio]SDH83541.1 hypothetical protein SAMN05421493_104155 [Pseudobutyrivibrio sp. 49]SFH57819.1 hypothetical protein SAMN04487830_102111 [Pseudobutyrivibrio sp. OR37]